MTFAAEIVRGARGTLRRAARTARERELAAMAEIDVNGHKSTVSTAESAMHGRNARAWTAAAADLEEMLNRLKPIEHFFDNTKPQPPEEPESTPAIVPLRPSGSHGTAEPVEVEP